jgi:hypothetical protein
MKYAKGNAMIRSMIVAVAANCSERKNCSW